MTEQIHGSVFSLLAELFSEKNVRVLLAGGYAMNAYKIQRMTFDIDFVISADDLVKIEHDILGKGYSIFNRTDAFIQFKNNIPGLRDIDFILVDENTIDGLLKEGRKIHFAGASFVVPSAKHMIAMKLHAIHGNSQRRIKDVPDIAFLLTSGNVDPEDESIRHLFEKYEAMDLYRNILERKL